MKHVIVGNGPAGVVAAETLRKLDPAGSIALVGDEPEPPYSRMALPYLMMGHIAESGTHLRKDPEHFRRQRIDLVRDRVDAVDAGVVHRHHGAAGRAHPVQRFVGAVVGMDRDRAVGLDQDQPGGHGEVGVQASRIVDRAAGDDEAHDRNLSAAPSPEVAARDAL